MTTSVSTRASSPFPPLPDSVLRARLAAVRDRVLEIRSCAPPDLACDFAGILDGIEDTLEKIGWQCPPLTAHDRAFLAAVGAL